VPTVQMNNRIDSELKRHGDTALKSIGLSPTKAIRSLWGFMERNSHDPEALRSLFSQLNGDTAGKAQDGDAARIALVNEGPRIFESSMKKLGINAATVAALDYDEVRARANLGKYASEGI